MDGQLRLLSDLQNQYITSYKFVNVDFTGADFRDALLSDNEFVNCNFSGAKMTNKNEEWLIFEVGDKRKCFPKKIFIQEMVKEAKHFFPF